MTKEDIIISTARETKIPRRKCTKVYDAAVSAIVCGLQRGENVYLGSQFGVLYPKELPPCIKIINGETWEIPARSKVVFKASSNLKAALNGGAEEGGEGNTL